MRPGTAGPRGPQCRGMLGRAGTLLPNPASLQPLQRRRTRLVAGPLRHKAPPTAAGRGHVRSTSGTNELLARNGRDCLTPMTSQSWLGARCSSAPPSRLEPGPHFYSPPTLPCAANRRAGSASARTFGRGRVAVRRGREWASWGPGARGRTPGSYARRLGGSAWWFRYCSGRFLVGKKQLLPCVPGSYSLPHAPSRPVRNPLRAQSCEEVARHAWEAAASGVPRGGGRLPRACQGVAGGGRGGGGTSPGALGARGGVGAAGGRGGAAEGPPRALGGGRAGCGRCQRRGRRGEPARGRSPGRCGAGWVASLCLRVPRTHPGVWGDPKAACRGLIPALGFWTEAGAAWARRVGSGRRMPGAGGLCAGVGWRDRSRGAPLLTAGSPPPQAPFLPLQRGGLVCLVSFFSPPLFPCSILFPLPAPFSGLERELAPPPCPPPPPPPPLMSISALLSMGRCCCRCCCPRGLWMLSAPCCDDRRMCVCPGPRRIGRYLPNYLRWVPRKDGD